MLLLVCVCLAACPNLIPYQPCHVLGHVSARHLHSTTRFWVYSEPTPARFRAAFSVLGVFFNQAAVLQPPCA